MPVPPKPPAPFPPPTPAPPPTQVVTKPLPPSKTRHWLVGTLVVLCCLGILGVLGLIYWPKLKDLQKSFAPTAPTSIIPSEITVPAKPTSTAPTTAPATTTEAAQPEEIPTYTLGETVVLFQNDEAVYRGRKAGQTFKITALEFSDSRCPKGVQCVWAGELGVKLRVTDGKDSQDFYLGMVRAKTASTMGLKFTLIEIDDGKGGFYAKIKVE